MEGQSEVVPTCIICGSTSVVPPVSNKFVGGDESQAHLTALFILTKVLNTPQPEVNLLLGQKEPIPDVLMSTCGACEKSLRQFQNTLKLMSRFEKRLTEIRKEIKDRVRQSLDKVKLGGTGCKEPKQGGGSGCGGEELNGGHHHDPEVFGAMGLSEGQGVVAVAEDIPTPVQPCEDPFAKFCIETGNSQLIDEEYKICIEYDNEEELDTCQQDNHQDSYGYQDFKNIASALIQQDSILPPVIVREHIPVPIQISSEKRPFILYADTEISCVDPERDNHPPNPIKTQKRPKLKTGRKVAPLEFVRKKKRFNCYNCNKCPFSTSIRLQHERHSLLHEEGAIVVICSDCGWYVRPVSLNLHRARRHPNVKTPGLDQPRKYSYNCQVCPFKTTNDVLFKAHWESHYPSLGNRNQQGKKAVEVSSPLNLGDKPDNANETQRTVGSSTPGFNAHGSREVFMNTLRFNWKSHLLKKFGVQLQHDQNP